MEPKKLYRSRKNSYVAGVCGGIAEYFGIDVTWIRLGLIIFCLMGGSGVLAYIIAALVIPKEPKKKKKKDDAYDYDRDFDREEEDRGNGPRI